jgi:hypothetical protein
VPTQYSSDATTNPSDLVLAFAGRGFEGRDAYRDAAKPVAEPLERRFDADSLSEHAAEHERDHQDEHRELRPCRVRLHEAGDHQHGADGEGRQPERVEGDLPEALGDEPAEGQADRRAYRDRHDVGDDT